MLEVIVGAFVGALFIAIGAFIGIGIYTCAIKDINKAKRN